MIRRSALAALLAFAALALSQPPDAAAQSARVRPKPAPTGRAIARALIGENRDVFEDVSVGEWPQVRHRGSGLVCRFFPDLGVRPPFIVTGGLPRGDDVGCQLPVPSETQFHTVYATRYPQTPALEQALADAVQAIRAAYGSLQPYNGRWVEVPLKQEGLRPPPPSRSAIFLVQHEGRPHMTRVSVAVVNGWVIKHRFTTPVPESDEDIGVLGDTLAGMAWREILLRFTNGDAVNRELVPD